MGEASRRGKVSKGQSKNKKQNLLYPLLDSCLKGSSHCYKDKRKIKRKSIFFSYPKVNHTHDFKHSAQYSKPPWRKSAWKDIGWNVIVESNYMWGKKIYKLFSPFEKWILKDIQKYPTYSIMLCTPLNSPPSVKQKELKTYIPFISVRSGLLCCVGWTYSLRIRWK